MGNFILSRDLIKVKTAPRSRKLSIHTWERRPALFSRYTALVPRSSVFLILPLMVFGISATNSTIRSHLYSASF